MKEATLHDAYGHWGTHESALIGRYREVLVLQEAIDKSNAALAEAVKTKEERDSLLLQVAQLKKALERIVAMDAVTAEERQHFWTDRAERMRDFAAMALGGEPVPPLSQLLETYRRGLSYIQHGAKDLDDARRAAEHAIHWTPSSEESHVDRYRKALEYIAEGGKLSPMEVARNALPQKCACGGYGKVVGGDGNFYTCPDCGGAGHAHEPTEKSEHEEFCKVADERATKAEALNLQVSKGIQECEKHHGCKGDVCLLDTRYPCHLVIEAALRGYSEKPKYDWAICGWCAGDGLDHGVECPKCKGAGGKALGTESCESIYPRWNARCCLPRGHQGRHESKGGDEKTMFLWASDQFCQCGLPLTGAMHICAGPVQFPRKDQ